MLHQAGGVTLDGANYTVDAAGNRTSKTNLLNSVAENYSYDAIYQLTQVVQGSNTTESYTYDQVGNRLSSLGVPTYTVNNSNELTSTSTATFTYDNNGNTLTKTDSTGTTTYAWDFENRLVSVTLPGTGGTVSFKYDPFGRRIQKSGPSGTTNYLYDGANVLEEVDVSGSVLAGYTQGAGIDEPFAMLRGGVTDYYQADGLGSITSVRDAAGGLVASYTYDTFGNLTASTGTLANPFRYTGREFDTDTGLYYYRARYYDPVVARFVSEDPIRFKGGIDSYVYAKNNAVNFSDPGGLAPQATSDYKGQPHGTYQVCACYRVFPFPFAGECQYQCFCEPFGLPIVFIGAIDLAKTCGMGTCRFGPLCPRIALVETTVQGPYGWGEYSLFSCAQ